MLCKEWQSEEKKHNTASCPSFFGSNKVCGKGNIHHVGYELFSVCWMTGGDPSGIHHLSNWVISPLAGWERMKSDTSGVACREEGQSGCISFARNFGRATAFVTTTLTDDNKWRLRGSAAPLTCKYSHSVGPFPQTFTDFHIHNQNGIMFFFF